ncbi:MULTISPECIES: hypothetical protein [Coriobacteriia]|uniref:hypothetical protein n=1 Tax=Coriobacteriia TaxID=84998 RepID=UPI002F95B046
MNKALNVGVRRAIRTAAALYGAVWLACLALYWGSLATGGLGGGVIMGCMKSGPAKHSALSL